MKKQIKITKREIKEDKFTTFMLIAKDYATENWRFLVGAVAAVVIIFVAIKLWQSQDVKQEQEAADMFNRGLAQMRGDNFQLAIVDFKKIVDEFGSTTQAEVAAFNLGNAYLGNKNYTEAKAAYEAFLNRNPQDKFFVTSALAGIAACQVGSGDLAGAADKYREAAEKYPDFEYAGEYFLKAMQCYAKVGNLESARVIYAKMSKDFIGTPYLAEGQRLAGEYNIQL